jgi:hypothetical protein
VVALGGHSPCCLESLILEGSGVLSQTELSLVLDACPGLMHFACAAAPRIYEPPYSLEELSTKLMRLESLVRAVCVYLSACICDD